jgi:membrane protein implicated in regulation of membrane protease activity
MRVLFFGFLFLAAVGLIAALLIGVAIKIVMFLALAAIVLAGLGWLTTKLKGLTRDNDANREDQDDLHRLMH